MLPFFSMVLYLLGSYLLFYVVPRSDNDKNYDNTVILQQFQWLQIHRYVGYLANII